MANLTLDNASIGFDTKGVNQVIEDIKLTVIDEAKKRMDDSFVQLEYSLTAAWQGTSADNFRGLMESHKEKIKKEMDACHTIITAELNAIANAIDKFDKEAIATAAKKEG